MSLGTAPQQLLNLLVMEIDLLLKVCSENCTELEMVFIILSVKKISNFLRLIRRAE